MTEGLHFILLGLGLLVTGVVLFRGFARGKQIRNRDPLSEALHDVRRIESSAVGLLNAYQVRLAESHRETTATLEMRISQLQQLLAERDNTLMTQANSLSEDSQRNSLSQLAILLSNAGYSVDEIACLLSCDASQIPAFLHADPSTKAA